MSLFNSIKIRTPESVELEFSLAGIGSRAVALLVDYTVLGAGITAVMVLAFYILAQLNQTELFLNIDADVLELWVQAIYALVLFGLYVGYFVGFETLWQGQTPGKRYARIRVIRDNAQPVSLFQATLRSLLRPVDDIPPSIGLFFILFGKREKRIGDWLAGTLVVQTDPRNDHKGIVISKDAEIFGDILLTTLNFAAITPDDFATLREYLQRRKSMTLTAQTTVSNQLSERLQEKTELEALPAHMTAPIFIEAVYWAYQNKNK